MDPQLLAFVAVIVGITVMPGADMALITRQVLAGGRRAGLAGMVGICGGLCVHATLCVVGLSALLLQSSTAFTAVKLAGACYLVWLGVRAFVAAGRIEPAPEAAEPAPAGRLRTRTAFLQGLVTNVLNPKIAVLYVAVLPQFMAAGDGAGRLVLLAGIQIAIGVVWLVAFITMLAHLRSALERPRVRAAIERVTGSALIAFGARLAAGTR